jgi:hypothetical protein
MQVSEQMPRRERKTEKADIIGVRREMDLPAIEN